MIYWIILSVVYITIGVGYFYGGFSPLDSLDKRYKRWALPLIFRSILWPFMLLLSLGRAICGGTG